jgi:predicted nucleotidyltransferase
MKESILTAAQAQLELDRIVQRIAEALEPEKIILFGSRARGDAREDSDADLLIVVPDGIWRARHYHPRVDGNCH